MEWKNIVDKPDIKVFESKNDEKIRIEARYEDKRWHIIERNLSDPSKYIQEYEVESKDFEDFLKKIMKKSYNHKKEHISVKIYRIFKDSFAEKWLISVNDEKYSNFVLVHYDDLVTLDLVLHMKYKPIEQKIIFDVVSSLGLNEDDLEYNIYYYTYSSRYFDMKYYDDEYEEDGE